MLLSKLINNLVVTKIFQTKFGKSIPFHDLNINKVEYDSRKVAKGDLFVAIKGMNYDGHKFIPDAVANGAVVVILEDDKLYPDSYFMHNDVTKIVVENSRKALAVISASLYNNPADQLNLIGVTGTNGKTTTTYIIKSILGEYIRSQNIDAKVGLIGTISNLLDDEMIPSELTTPESLELQKLLSHFHKSGCKWTVMEVSSHSLVQQRVYGLNFKCAIFTNLSPEHLDYHKTMEDYFKAKKILFDNLKDNAFAISNYDDPYGSKILKDTKASKLFYGLSQRADVYASDINMNFEGLKFNVHFRNKIAQIETPLIGKFNVYNCLAAIATAVLLDIDLEIVKSALKRLTTIKGRFETLISDKTPVTIIDYAHTPDALEKVLNSIKEILNTKKEKGRIITVFGAGGDRDKSKRPIMGKVVSELSDSIIITSDNPRTEDPKKIINNILEGIVRQDNVFVELDRKTAIEKAFEIAKPNDVIVIAGKGHEEYQIIGKDKIKFSDREIVENIIAKRK